MAYTVEWDLHADRALRKLPEGWKPPEGLEAKKTATARLLRYPYCVVIDAPYYNCLLGGCSPDGTRR